MKSHGFTADGASKPEVAFAPPAAPGKNWPTGALVASPRVHHLGDALHEIVRELQPSVVAARAKEGRELRAVLTEQKHRVEPSERVFGERVAAALEQECFRFAVRLRFQGEPAQLPP